MKVELVVNTNKTKSMLKTYFKTKDIVEILEYVLQNRAMAIDHNLALSHAINLLNEHDALVEEVEKLMQLLGDMKKYIEEKEKIIDGEWGGCKKLEELIMDGEMPLSHYMI
jgi:hypothetical protein